MTGELIAHDFEGGGLLAGYRELRRDVDRLLLGGWTGEGGPSPGALLSDAQADAIGGIQAFSGGDTSILLGNGSAQAIGTNELVGRTSAGAVDGISVSAQSVIGRAGSAVTNLTASASQLLARLASGDLAFQDRITWAADQDVMIGEAWPYEVVTGSVTLSEGNVLAILNHSTNITITLPTPTYTGKVFLVVDPLQKMSGTSTVTFATAGGSDKIGGATGTTSALNLPGEIFFFFCALTTGPVANWTSRRLNTVIP